MLVQIFAKNKMNIIAVLILSLMTSFAWSQEDDGDEPVVQRSAGKESKVFMQFGNELIDGKAVNPSVEYLFNRTQFNFKRMIRLRENFQSEVKQGRGDFSGAR